ncbi:MAG TPA: MBL fold metallo-hydrolase [Egibacteraceae bacterium]|nr:MBL fold metallo-hydrolase [Egibacteraceae bacterium]
MALGKDSRYLEGFELGVWQANCYILGDFELGSAVVVDPGEGGDEAVRARLEARGARCEAILLTHGHLDHLWSAPALAAELDAPVLLHPDDRWLWDNPAAAFGPLPKEAVAQQFGLDWDPPADGFDELRDGQSLHFAGFGFQVRHTPGHTPGSCVFLLTEVGQDDPVLLSGDLIFAGSVGRTDFPRGSWDEQMDSIKRVVLPLDDATQIHSGHGPVTTVGRERAANPYLQGLA